MCSRFALISPPQTIANHLKVEKTLDWDPRYNVAPSQRIPVVLRTLEDKGRRMEWMKWGFTASWYQGGRLIVNARSEEIGEKPLFRESFEKWRCLVPVDGFYEWRNEAKQTRPYFIRRKDKHPFALAGIWASQKPEAGVFGSCAILTTAPNNLVRAIHDRMPVILDPRDYGTWLDQEDVRDFDALKGLFEPFSPEGMEAYQVADRVNHVARDDEKCLERSDEPETLSFDF